MKKEEIRELIDLLQGTDVSEIEIENEGKRIRVRRHVGPEHPELVVPVVQPTATPAAAPEAAETEGAGLTEPGQITIRSPIVGTFYRSPSPEVPPYVEVGGHVGKGQVLCIVEAMKLMNEIEAETDGEIVRVLAESGQAVEYGQPLFIINPA